ncbi:hypothetical protein PR003_g33083 [Phytophthora rubi]|uniref:Uncharacterized protein n=1 Tax=Phytophthora rubi TaxID=129364 RepID=A0A6A4AXR7_9STRA|nr:hypothetical protein PR001_g31272 [Phytophthora rubi]KAE9263650.1 hypothetical protein PR003_g33083 [Phytophthora rubi]
MSVAGSGATTGLEGILKLLQVVAVGVVRRASVLARAVALEVQVMCAGVAAARARQRQRGLVVAHEIGDVFKKAAKGLLTRGNWKFSRMASSQLPRVQSRRVSNGDLDSE